jgi:ATPase subunit of ABC transporter with duplicated ATPase domains
VQRGTSRLSQDFVPGFCLKDFEGTMIFVSHDRMFLRGLGSRVLELGGESGTDRNPTVYPGSYVEYVQKLGHEAPGIYS